MPEAFSFSREFDYVRLEGLGRVTGRPPHEWDLYIIKELIDNALDADELLWRVHGSKAINLHISIEYIVSGSGSQKLIVEVKNEAAFPVSQINPFFATQWYTSQKAFNKGLARGALGNALKTLLGIPYALHYRAASDWSPELKPLTIVCNGTEYLPRYIVDSTTQSIRFECEEKPIASTTGTLIRVSLDEFVQEKSRTFLEIELLAQQYHLCNPHVQFHWTVEMGEQLWTLEYAADPIWKDKYQGATPVQWYSLGAFKDLLRALYRLRCGDTPNCVLPIVSVCQYLAEPTEGDKSQECAAILSEVGRHGLTREDIDGQTARLLYGALHRHSRRFEPRRLGSIGLEHVKAALKDILPVEDEILYEIAMDDGSKPNMPFVIEVALARLNHSKRQIWSAINFSPTYGDPFFGHRLYVPKQPSEPVLGLGGLLDAYGFREDVSLILFVHLICPNIEHQEFSKTEINHLPFRDILCDLLDRLLVTFKGYVEAEEIRMEQAIFEKLDGILIELKEKNEQFIPQQLLEKLSRELKQDPVLATWLGRAGARDQLEIYLARYQLANHHLAQYITPSIEGTLCIPLHPNRHFVVLARDVSGELLQRYQVNKILVVQSPELEPVIVNNGWLCQMDMALLSNLFDLQNPQRVLFQCLADNDLPIVILHNADEEGQLVVKQVREWLEEEYLNADRVIDLGLDTQDDLYPGMQHHMLLIEMMPHELEEWLLNGLFRYGLPVKFLPSDEEIRKDITGRFQQLLQGHLVEGMLQKFEIIQLLDKLDRRFEFTTGMKEQALDEKLKNCLEREAPLESYRTVLNEIVGAFFEDLLYEQNVAIQEVLKAHIALLQKENHDD